MSSASDVFNAANQENRTSHFGDSANLKMVQQHMNNAANQDNRVERNTPLTHFADSNLKMVQLGAMGRFGISNIASSNSFKSQCSFILSLCRRYIENSWGHVKSSAGGTE